MSMTFSAGDLELNVANANGFLILEALGQEPDYCGTLDPVEVLSRIDAAEASRETVSEGNFHAFGADFDRYRERVRAIAEAAVRLGVQIQFG